MIYNNYTDAIKEEKGRKNEKSRDETGWQAVGSGSGQIRENGKSTQQKEEVRRSRACLPICTLEWILHKAG